MDKTKTLSAPRELEERKTPRDRAKLMANLQKLGQSRLVFVRNMWTYTLSLRLVASYLVRFGEAHSLLSSNRDPMLFRSLQPLIDPRFNINITNVKEEQPPTSFQQLAAFLDAVISSESNIIKKSLVLPRLHGAEEQLKSRFDKALPKGLEGIESVAKESTPAGIKRADWQLTNALFLADLVGKLFSAILPQCTPSSCPEMDISEEVCYMWKDEYLTGGIVLSASEYAQNFIKWVQVKVNKIESGLVSDKKSKSDDAEVRHLCATLFTKLAHILAHIKYKHVIRDDAGKAKSSPNITKGKKLSSRKEDGKSETKIRVSKKTTKGDLAQDEAFAHQIKKIQITPVHPARKMTSSVNVPSPLSEMTEFLLREEVEISLTKTLELEENQPNCAENFVSNYQTGQDLTAVKPEVVMGGVAFFLGQMETPIILPDYIECFGVALTMPTADIRLACVEKTLLLFRGLEKELVAFVFSFFHSLIEEKHVNSFEICSYFGPKIVRQPTGNVSDSLASAITRIILSNFAKFFTPPDSGKKKHVKSPREGMNPARRKKSRGSIDQMGKLMEQREEGETALDLESQDQKEEEKETTGGNFGTFVVRDVEEDENNNNFGTFVMKDADDNNFGTFVMKDADDNSGNFGTFVMNDTGSNESGTFVLSEVHSDSLPKKRDAAQAVLDNYIQMANPSPEQPRKNVGGSQGGTPRGPVTYREPEKWEKNLVSLTKGELEEMESDSAFNRYTKKRGGLKAMDWSTSASTEEKNEEIEKALDGEEAKKIKKFANLWKRTSMMTEVSPENFAQFKSVGK